MKKLLLIVSLMLCAVMLLSFASAENRTRQEAVAWANSRLNEGWKQDYDGLNGCQDIDLIKYYYTWLGQNRVYGYAYTYVNCALPTGWTRSSVPQTGDIVVWGANVGIAGQYGHVGIVIAVNGSNVTYVATNDGAVQCTSHTVNRYNASTYIHPAFLTYASLDLNWRVDGVDQNSTQSAGTADVYINGVRVADDASDYYASHAAGSTYEIRDIKPKSGYSYAGVVTGSLSGTLSGNVEVRLSFVKNATPSYSGTGVTITGDNVPVRSYPSTTSYSLGTAVKGSSYQYLNSTFTDNRGVNWYKILFNGQNGWVSSRLSKLGNDPGGYKSGDRVNVVSGNTNIRNEPNLYCTILGVAYKGSGYEYLGQTATDDRGITWYLIRYKNSSAWISSRYTQLEHSGSYDWGSDDWGSDDWGSLTPTIASVNQSAYLVSNNPVVDGAKAFDGDKSTCWCVSEYNYSFGQWVEVRFTAKRTVTGFTIYNGYNKTRGNNDYWYLNSRVSNIAVYCDDSYVGTFKLTDTRAAQSINLGWPVSGTSFKFVIRGAYAGSKYADVCISEIEFK